VNDFLSFTAHRKPQRQTFLVGELVEEACAAFARELEANLIDAEIDVPPNTLVTADREMIRQMLNQLILNAVEVMPDGGELVITSYDCADGLELEIADSGPGLSDEEKQQIFGQGRGKKHLSSEQGLALVYQIAEAHGGSITATNCPEGGAAFTIKIPRRALGAAA